MGAEAIPHAFRRSLAGSKELHCADIQQLRVEWQAARGDAWPLWLTY